MLSVIATENVVIRQTKAPLETFVCWMTEVLKRL